MKTIIFESAEYIVEFNRYSGDPFVTICFDNFMPNQGFHLTPFGEKFLNKHHINNVIVNAANNDWYQAATTLDIAQLIRDATNGMVRVGYGSSMGGFAVLDLFEELGLSRAVALCPQFSIDGALVPFENRWLDEAAGTTFRHGSLQTAGTIGRAIIVSDPLHWLDARHVQLIRALHNVQLFPIPLCGHDPAEYLRRAGMLSEITLDLIHGRFDPGAWRHRIRAQRLNNNRYWLNLSFHMWNKGRPRDALEAAQTALRLAGDEADEERAHFENLEKLTATASP